MSQEQIDKVSESYNKISNSLELLNKSGSFTLEQSSSIYQSLLIVKQVCEAFMNQQLNIIKLGQHMIAMTQSYKLSQWSKE